MSGRAGREEGEMRRMVPPLLLGIGTGATLVVGHLIGMRMGAPDVAFVGTGLGLLVGVAMGIVVGMLEARQSRV